MSGRKVSLPLLAPYVPGRRWLWFRRFMQAFAWVALLVAPLLGGWQRLERNYMSAWDGHGWDLPPDLLDALPSGETARQAYDVNQLTGGGLALDLFGVSAVDPAAAILVVGALRISAGVAVALGLPLLVGLIAGRWFCGFMCPFGTLSRLLEAGLARLPWRPRAFQVPRSRLVRWAILIACLILGQLFGVQLLYFFLPHLMLQQAAYGMWLAGGGGVVLGWLIGLILAGLWLGPTTYCATLCPTGGVLSVLGRARVLHVSLAEPAHCGRHCQLCSNACWLGLDPAMGDPGPDCDSCARCFSVCPQTNLRMGLSRPRPRWPKVAVPILLVLLAVPASAAPDEDASYRDTVHPRLSLSSELKQEGVRALVSAVALRGVRPGPDSDQTESALRFSAVVMRGPRTSADEYGKLKPRDVYTGPLTVHVETATQKISHSFSEPNTPKSTPRRALYTVDFDFELEAGDRIAIDPLEGWTTAPLVWTIPRANNGTRLAPGLWAALASFLLVSALLSIALLLGQPSRRVASTE